MYSIRYINTSSSNRQQQQNERRRIAAILNSVSKVNRHTAVVLAALVLVAAGCGGRRVRGPLGVSRGR